MSADMIDPDTRRTLASGRRTLGELWVAARSKLRRVFLVFVVGLLGTIYAMRVWIWPVLEADLLAKGASVVAITPFDVILLQAKIGIFVGILLSIPFFIYYARDPLRRRGLYPTDEVATWKLLGIAAVSATLFAGGVTYSYNVFFPVMFKFLAHNAVSAGLVPQYSIVDWTQFIMVLGLSFGLAAQLPLAMTVLAYAEIVPYETFRDKWKYAILTMFGFGALFSPPDPFTQLMWAAPLVALYAISLYLARAAVALRRGGEAIDVVGSVRANRTSIAAGFVLAGGIAAWFATDGASLVNRAVLPLAPAAYRPAPLSPDLLLPFGATASAAALGLAAGTAAALLLTAYYAWPTLEPREQFGEPAAIDLDGLDAAGIRAAPPEAFDELTEETAVAHAERAVDDGQPEKARAILDRFDRAEADREAVRELEEREGAAGPEPAPDPEPAGGGGVGGAVQRTTAGVVGAFTEDDDAEDDIGGYYYDLLFILDSLRSRAFRIFAVFFGVLAGVFTFLYSGGIGTIKNDFLRRLPSVVRPEEVDVITLHPVEALVFEVKIATLLGLVATVPLLLYYAWPALTSRGLVRGDRNVLFGWGGAMVVALVGGSAFGYLVVAPAVVSYFVWDAFRADMIIAYRVSNFMWLIFFTTVGIGLLLTIPTTMLLFHRGGLVSYADMRGQWRGVTVAVLAFAAIFTPASVLSMILVTIPIMIAYGFGLAVLWLYTLGGRRGPPRSPAGS